MKSWKTRARIPGAAVAVVALFTLLALWLPLGRGEATPGGAPWQQACTEPYVFLYKWGTFGSGDGQLFGPWGVALDGAGNAYVAEVGNHRLSKFTSTGQFLAKWGGLGGGDGQMSGPAQVAVDGQNNVYVADSGNQRIQKFTLAGAFLSAWGGLGNGPGQFAGPLGVVVDGTGNVYVADNSNHRIQKFTSTGVFLTQWGGLGTGDGEFIYPHTLAVAGGNIYVADYGNHRIQRFTSAGVFLAKWGSEGMADGQFKNPIGVAVDSAGNVFVGDTGNARIQKFTSAGVFVTKWGSFGFADGQFNSLAGVAVDAAGKVYVADNFNNRVQVFGPCADIVTPTPTPTPTSTPTPTPTKSPTPTPTPKIDVPVQSELFIYSVKFVCGNVRPLAPKPSLPGITEPFAVVPGAYRTSVNIHNYWEKWVAFEKKAAEANPQDKERGRVSARVVEKLAPNGAVAVTCTNVTQLLGPPIPEFLEGFVVIESPVELEVTAVYTVEELLEQGISISVVPKAPHRVKRPTG
ncbi:MAG: hypothetical protein HYX92_09895 [Chloroflexi bacterium]|nr:hypothetical protein [Chloroflexota bacterium]